MKNLIAMLALIASVANADPMESPNLTTQSKEANARYGVSNYKTVMPGVLYRGGSSGPKGGKAPLSSGSLQAMCNDGFNAAVYGYKTGWQGGEKSISCGNGQLTYTYKQWDNSVALKSVLTELRNLIVKDKGAMYVHCYYGVHASGFIVTAALMQFCGLSGSEGVDYWNSNVAKSIQYPKVQEMIRAFKPYSDLNITTDQQDRVCPKGL